MSAPALDPQNLDDAKLDALVELMLLSVHADGEFSEDERNAFSTRVAELSRGRVAGARFKGIADRVAALAEGGRPARISALGGVLGDATTCEAALALVVQMVAADGVIRTSERELILEVADGLGVDGDRAADLVRAAG